MDALKSMAGNGMFDEHESKSDLKLTDEIMKVHSH